MTKDFMLAHVDHTLLKAFADWESIQKICEEAIQYKTASICIPPSYIPKIKEVYGDSINICTVIGFPLGYNTTESKVFEAKDALAKGASEIDMVINIAETKNGNFEYVKNEIAALRRATEGHILKVIIETCYLTEEEKIKLCEIITETGADFIKTSTGFGTDGATIEDINLFAKHIGSNVKMKAAGGVKSASDLEMFLSAGCKRIGTSSAVALLSDTES